jgi:hypothetical protein
MEEIELEPLNIPYVPVVYAALYDSNTGEVISVGPESAFANQTNKIVIDQEIAEKIIEGSIRLSSCFIDMTSNTFEIAEVKSIFKIDDVLCRIIDRKWSSIEKPDVFVTYNKKKNTLKFELTEELGGTKKLPKKFQPVKTRKIVWSGDTDMNFLVTDFNDPNVLYKMISFKISDLNNGVVVVEGVELPSVFSIYTRRLFKNYVMEVK